MNTSFRDLYRNILRVHRLLPAELRVVGDAYVKTEFNLHKKITNTGQIEAFKTEWTKYFDNLSDQVIQDYVETRGNPDLSEIAKDSKAKIDTDGNKKVKPLGRKLEMNRLSEFNDDQLYTLMELRKYASGAESEPVENDKNSGNNSNK